MLALLPKHPAPHFSNLAIHKFWDVTLLADEDRVLTKFSSQMDRPLAADVQDQDAFFGWPRRIISHPFPRKERQRLVAQ